MRLFLAGLLSTLGTNSIAVDGEAVYAQYCALCHESGAARTPTRARLNEMNAPAIVKTLETGSMRVVGTMTLNAQERVAVAEYLAGEPYDPNWKPIAVTSCTDTLPPLANFAAMPNWNGWGVDRGNTRFQPPDAAGLSAADIPNLKLQWAFGFPAETVMESAPTVVGGRLFIGSKSGVVYALDAKRGCAMWTHQAEAPVKTAVTLANIQIEDTPVVAAFFGDLAGKVYALNADTGVPLWSRRPEDHPMGRIAGGFQVFGNRLYVPVSSVEEGVGGDPKYECCTFRGALYALDPATGGEIWRRYTIAETPAPTRVNAHGTQLYGPSGAGIWSAATLDIQRGLIYIATGDNYSDPASKGSDSVLAVALDSGELVWQYQALSGDAWNIACDAGDRSNCPLDPGPDHDIGASPMLIKESDGNDVVIALQKSSDVHALDPGTGKLLWRKKIGTGGVLGGIQWGGAAADGVVFIPLSDVVPTSKSWFEAETAFDASKGGGLFALSAADGKQVWRASPVPCAAQRALCSPAQSAAATAIDGAVFSASLGGYLRAYDSRSGALIWEYDTLREFETVNDVPARGGAIDGPGVVIADGWLYATSGYATWGGAPGNVLLAFKPAPPKTDDSN